MTIKEWQGTVDKWIKEYGVRYFDERTNALILSEEVGEFSRIIARAYGEQSWKQATSKEDIKVKLADELADIIWVSTCLANQLDIDLTAALEANMNKKTARDKERHDQNPKLK